MTPAAYDQVLQALSRLADMVPRPRTYIPHYGRSKCTCLVDQNLVVHALRCARNPDDDAPAIRPLEYTTVRPGSTDPPVWQPVGGAVFNPAFPALAHQGDRWVAGVVCTPEASEQVLRTLAYQVLLIPLGQPRATEATVGLKRVSAAVRLALGPGGAVYTLGQQWYPPPALPRHIPLVLGISRGADSRVVVDPVPGTDTDGSHPRDSALHVTAEGQVHIVYDGFHAGTKGDRPFLWHLTLDGQGKLLGVEKLGEAPPDPVLTRVFRGPGRRLACLVVSATGEDRRKFSHRIYVLQGADPEPGPREQYFVDYWLQLHAVWFDGAAWQYKGPAGVPAGAAPSGPPATPGQHP
jgi:hypothetical protein